MTEITARIAYMLYLSLVIALVVVLNMAAFWLMIEFGPDVIDYLLT